MSQRRLPHVSDQLDRFHELAASVNGLALPSEKGKQSTRATSAGLSRKSENRNACTPLGVRPLSAGGDDNLPGRLTSKEDLFERVVQRHRNRALVVASEQSGLQTSSEGELIPNGKLSSEVPAFRLEKYAQLLSTVSDITDVSQSIRNANRVLDGKATVANCLHRHEMNQIKRRTIAAELEEEAVKAQQDAEVMAVEARQRHGEIETEMATVERAEYSVQLHAEDLSGAISKLSGLGMGLGEMAVRARDVAIFSAAMRAKRSVGTLTVLSLPTSIDHDTKEGASGELKQIDTLHLSHIDNLERKLASRTKALMDSLRVIDSLTSKLGKHVQREAEGRRLAIEELDKLKLYTKALEEGDGFTFAWALQGGEASSAPGLYDADDTIEIRLRDLLGSALEMLGYTKFKAGGESVATPIRAPSNENATADIQSPSLLVEDNGRGSRQEDFFFLSPTQHANQLSSPMPTSRSYSRNASLRHGPISGDTSFYSTISSTASQTQNSSPQQLSFSSPTSGLRAGSPLSSRLQREQAQQTRQQHQQAETLRAMRQELEYSESEVKFLRLEVDKLKQQCSANERSVVAAQLDATNARSTSEAKLLNMSARVAELTCQASEFDALKRLNSNLSLELDTIRRSHDQLLQAAANITAEDPERKSDPERSSTSPAIAAALGKVKAYEQLLQDQVTAVAAGSYALLGVFSSIQSIVSVLPSSPSTSFDAFSSELESTALDQHGASAENSQDTDSITQPSRILGEHQNNNKINNARLPLRFLHTSYNRIFDAVVDGGRDVLRMLDSLSGREASSNASLLRAALTGSNAGMKAIDATASRAHDIIGRPRPSFLSQQQPRFDSNAARSSFSFEGAAGLQGVDGHQTPFTATLDGYFTSPYQEGMSQLDKGIHEMARLNEARRKVLFEGLSVGMPSGPFAQRDESLVASGINVSEQGSAGGPSSASFLVPSSVGEKAWQSDLAYFESLALRMLRMTARGKFENNGGMAEVHENLETKAAARSESNSKNHKPFLVVRSRTDLSGRTSQPAKCESLAQSLAQSESERQFGSPESWLSPAGHALFTIAHATELLVEKVAMPLRRYEKALTEMGAVEGVVSPLNQILVTVPLFHASKCEHTNPHGNGLMTVDIPLTEVLWRVIDLGRQLSLAMRFRRVRERVGERAFIHHQAAKVLLQVAQAREAVGNAAGIPQSYYLGATWARESDVKKDGMPEQKAAKPRSNPRSLVHQVKKSVRINEGGNTVVAVGSSSLVSCDKTILRQEGGASILRRSTSSKDFKSSRNTTLKAGRDDTVEDNLSSRAELAARAVSRIEAARASVRSLLRIYQKTYPPMPYKSRNTGGWVLFSSNIPNSQGPVTPPQTKSLLEADTSAWCLATMVRGLESVRTTLVSEQRMHLEPSMEIVHPVEAGSLTCNDMDFIRLHSERLVLLEALIPFSNQLRKWADIDTPLQADRFFESDTVPQNSRGAPDPNRSAEESAFASILRSSCRVREKPAALLSVPNSEPNDICTKAPETAARALSRECQAIGNPVFENNTPNTTSSVGDMRAILFGHDDSECEGLNVGVSNDMARLLRSEVRNGIARFSIYLRQALTNGSSVIRTSGRGVSGTPRTHTFPPFTFPEGDATKGVVESTIVGDAMRAAQCFATYFESSQPTVSANGGSIEVMGSEVKSVSAGQGIIRVEKVTQKEVKEKSRGRKTSTFGGSSPEASDVPGSDDNTSGSSVMEPEEALRRATALIDSWFQNDTDDGYGLGFGSAGARTFASQSQWGDDGLLGFEEEATDAGESKGEAKVDTKGPIGKPQGGKEENRNDRATVALGAPRKSVSQSNTEQLLIERVMRLEDQLKTTKMKMSEYLRELFTQKSFLPSSKKRGVGGATRTVRVLISEPARFNLTRELELPRQLVGGVLVTGATKSLGSTPIARTPARRSMPSLGNVSDAMPNDSTSLQSSSLRGDRCPSGLPRVALSEPRGDQVIYDTLDTSAAFTPPSRASDPDGNDARRAVKGTRLVLLGARQTERSLAGSGLNKTLSSPSNISSSARPLSGAAVGLRQHLSAYARRQLAPVKDKSVGCDLTEVGAEMGSPSVDVNVSRRLSTSSLGSSK